MLISHKYKFIFLKAFKVSGTSTESFLERYCLSDEDKKNMYQLMQQLRL